MKTAIVELESVSPYSQSKFHDTPKLEKEAGDDFEARTWRNRCHTTEEGNVFIPPMVFKNCIAEAAQFLSMTVKGKGKATWTKNFLAGLLVTEGLTLPEKKESIAGEWFYMSATGKKGPGPRVKKCYPVVPKWSGKITVYVVDDAITEDIFKYHVEQAGNLIGIGRFRPRVGGFYGRFKVKSIKWIDEAKQVA